MSDVKKLMEQEMEKIELCWFWCKDTNTKVVAKKYVVNQVTELAKQIDKLQEQKTCPHIISADEGTSYCDLAYKTAEEFKKLQAERDQLRDLIGHMWVHNGYEDCGKKQMTTKQKKLYEEVIAQQTEDKP